MDILQSIEPEVLSTPFKSVSDRYFTHKYVRDVPKSEKLKNVQQTISFHSNRVAMVSLADQHDIFTQNKSVASVNWQVNEKINRANNKMSGKGKRGAQKLKTDSVICEITCTDDSKYSVYSCLEGKLLEINELLSEKPNLLKERPRDDGYIALILPSFSFKESELDTTENA